MWDEALPDFSSSDYSTPADALGGFESQVYQAIYSAASGYADRARNQLSKAILGTGEGKKMQAVATKQTLQQYAPYIIVGALLLMFVGVLLGRR